MVGGSRLVAASASTRRSLAEVSPSALAPMRSQAPAAPRAMRRDLGQQPAPGAHAKGQTSGSGASASSGTEAQGQASASPRPVQFTFAGGYGRGGPRWAGQGIVGQDLARVPRAIDSVAPCPQVRRLATRPPISRSGVGGCAPLCASFSWPCRWGPLRQRIR